MGMTVKHRGNVAEPGSLEEKTGIQLYIVTVSVSHIKRNPQHRFNANLLSVPWAAESVAVPRNLIHGDLGVLFG